MGDALNATLTWKGSLRFEAAVGSGHSLLLDSPARPDHAGPSPMEAMLAALGGCTAMDVAAILERMREPPVALTVEVRGERAPTNPKRFTALAFSYHVTGHQLTREKVERAVELSHSTYCSALASLRPDCAVTSSIEISEP